MPKDIKRIAVDTAVQPKTVAHPTDGGLTHKATGSSWASRGGTESRSGNSAQTRQTAERFVEAGQRLQNANARLLTCRVERDLAPDLAEDSHFSVDLRQLLAHTSNAVVERQGT